MSRIAVSHGDGWIGVPVPNPDARVRLLCLPYAGGGASVFRGWQHAFPSDVEVALARLPAREGRFAEPLVDRMAALVEGLADAVTSQPVRRLAVFGHSMGARVAFELARTLRRGGLPEPVRVYVSAARAPKLPPPTLIHRLPDDEFLRHVCDLGGIPPSILATPELLAAAMRILRADYTALETCTYSDDPPLGCPIHAFVGIADPEVTPAAVDAWRAETSSTFKLHLVPGDHFFLYAQRDVLTRTIAADLARLPAAVAS